MPGEAAKTHEATKRLRRPLHLLASLLLAACHDHADDGHGHDHGHDHGHGAAEEAEPEPISITRWTERYELFVEIPPPVKDAPIAYHAHVTRLADFQAVREGRFVARYKDASGKVVREHAQIGVKRPGIFVFEGEGLPVGTYTADMSYEHGGLVDTWDCGSIEVLAAAPPAAEGQADTSITFLKETQWKIEFATAWSTEREVRRSVSLSGVVEPAGSAELTFVAPTSGRFLHDPKRVLTVGTRVEKGDVLGTIVPNVEDADYSSLIYAVEEGALAKKQAEAEVARLEPLVEQGVLPERRLIEAKNDDELIGSRLRLAQQRLAATAGASKGGLTIKADTAGVVAEVAVKNGEAVSTGAALVRLGSPDRLWVRTRTFSRGPFDGAEVASLRAEAGAEVDLTAHGAAFLTPIPTVDPTTRVGSWLVDLGTGTGSLPPDVRVGASVVVNARVGEASRRVVVPRTAVVEIDTRPYVFVQADGEHFEKRPVTLGERELDDIAILRGVEKEERVVTVGGFDIHLAAVMGTVESHRH